jgi:hypothetical protein
MTSMLSRSMAAGSLYDGVLGLSILLALEPLSRILPIPFPSEPFYARMHGIFLLGLCLVYALPAIDLERHLRLVAVAILIRLGGGLYVIGYAATGEIAPFFHLFGAIDVVFGLWHLGLLHTERRAGVFDTLRGR